MSRPSTATAGYFYHSVSSGKTISLLVKRFGNNGYAAWFRLLELMTATDGHFLNFNEPGVLEHYCDLLKIREQAAMAILNYLGELGGIDGELWGRRIAWSQHLVDSLKRLYHDRHREPPKRPDLQSFNILPGIIGDTSPVEGRKEGCEGSEGRKKENPLRVPENGTRLASAFEELWKIYPVHKEKQPALKAFKELHPADELIAEMRAAIARQIAHKSECDLAGTFCPQFKYFSRWLKRGCWKDELDNPQTNEDRIAEEAWAKKMALRKERENAGG